MRCRLLLSNQRLGCYAGNKGTSTWGFSVVTDDRRAARPILYKLLREIWLDPPTMDKCSIFLKRPIPLMSRVMYGPAKMYILDDEINWRDEFQVVRSLINHAQQLFKLSNSDISYTVILTSNGATKQSMDESKSE